MIIPIFYFIFMIFLCFLTIGFMIYFKIKKCKELVGFFGAILAMILLYMLCELSSIRVIL